MNIELTNENDKFFDYCHFDYKPKIDFLNKYRSVNLLKHSFELMGAPSEFEKLNNILQENIGLKNTVWGVKKNGENLFWEYYFYNWKKKNPKIKISTILNALKELFNFNGEIDENLNYSMFSVDISKDIFANKKIEGIHVYVGNHNYFFDGNNLKLENHYLFFNPKEQIKQILDGVKNSAYIDFTKIDLKEILIPQLLQCKTVCVAKKQTNDAVYYSGLNLKQFIFFLKKFEYPKKIIEFLEFNSNKLDHLQYDIGFDYKMENGKLKILKSGYYGVF